MKVKEKGLTGRAAITRRENMIIRKGFNAFREMAKAKGDKDKGTESERPKPEVWLEFMGSKIRVYDEDGGTVKDEDVPHVKGTTLKFVGCGSQVRFGEIKVL
jgi:lupus La protein